MKTAELNGRYQGANLKRNRIEQVLRDKGPEVSIHEVRSALSGEGLKVHDADFYPIRRKVFGFAKRKLKRASTRMLKSELSNGIAALKHKSKPVHPLEHKVSIEDLRQVKDIADRVGGINQLASIVGLIAELAS